MLLVMGDFNAKVSRREPSAMSSAVGLYGLGETNEAGEQLVRNDWIRQVAKEKEMDI